MLEYMILLVLLDKKYSFWLVVGNFNTYYLLNIYGLNTYNFMFIHAAHYRCTHRKWQNLNKRASSNLRMSQVLQSIWKQSNFFEVKIYFYIYNCGNLDFAQLAYQQRDKNHSITFVVSNKGKPDFRFLAALINQLISREMFIKKSHRCLQRNLLREITVAKKIIV